MTHAPAAARSTAPRDLVLALLILLALCLALRGPALDRVALNPDESQYEATAAWLLDNGRSAFSLGYGTPYTIAVYKAVAGLFGPYAMFEVRLVILILCLWMAVTIFFLVRSETSLAPGLIAGIVFLFWNPLFEGHSANREWFAGALLLLSAQLYLLGGARIGRARIPWMLMAGFSAGAALWFKLHAGLMVLAIPTLMLGQALPRHARKTQLADFAAYTAGGLAAAVGYLLPFAAAGTAREYLAVVVADWKAYVVGNELAARAGAELGESPSLLDRFFLDLPHRGLLITVYAFAALALIAAVSRMTGRPARVPPVVGSRTALLFALQLITAVLTVRMGNRFFGHYYLFMAPAVALLFGLALDAARKLGRDSRAGLLISWALTAALLGELAAHAFLARSILPVAALVAGVSIAAWALIRPGRRATYALSWQLSIAGLMLVAEVALMGPPRSLPHHRRGFDELTARLNERSGPEDRLFVWGWSPEIYSLTRMTPASQFTISQYVVQDYRATVGQPALDADKAATLVGELEHSRPRFVVDASLRSWTMASSGDPEIYRLDRYSDFPFVELLRVDYRRIGLHDGCVLYERRGP